MKLGLNLFTKGGNPITWVPSQFRHLSPSLILDYSLNSYIQRTENGYVPFDIISTQQSRSHTPMTLSQDGVYRPSPSNSLRLEHQNGVLRGLLVEGSRTNFIRNSSAQGAIVGNVSVSPSSSGLPSNWGQFDGDGLIRTIVGTGTEFGLSYIDINYSGIASKTLTLFFETTTGIPINLGERYTVSAFIRLVSGSLTNVSSITFGASERTSSGNFLENNVTPITIDQSFKRYEYSATTFNASVARIHPRIVINTSFVNPVDFTLRIYNPQLEIGRTGATNPIVTTGSTVTYPNESYNFLNSVHYALPTEGCMFVKTRYLNQRFNSFDHVISKENPSSEFNIFTRPNFSFGLSSYGITVASTNTSGVFNNSYVFGYNWGQTRTGARLPGISYSTWERRASFNTNFRIETGFSQIVEKIIFFDKTLSQEEFDVIYSALEANSYDVSPGIQSVGPILAANPVEFADFRNLYYSTTPYNTISEYVSEDVKIPLPKDIKFSANTFSRANTTEFQGFGNAVLTANSNSMRFDVQGNDKALILENEKTNLVIDNTFSSQGGNTIPSFMRVVSSAGLTTSVISKGAKDGLNYIDVRINGTATDNVYNLAFNQNSITSNANHTFSVYVNQISGSNTGFSEILNSGVNLTRITETAQTEFSSTRVWTTANTSSNEGNFILGLVEGASIDATFRIGLPQVESNNVSSVIKTSGSTKTRNSETFEISKISQSAIASGNKVFVWEKYKKPSLANSVTLSNGKRYSGIAAFLANTDTSLIEKFSIEDLDKGVVYMNFKDDVHIIGNKILKNADLKLNFSTTRYTKQSNGYYRLITSNTLPIIDGVGMETFGEYDNKQPSPLSPSSNTVTAQGVTSSVIGKGIENGLEYIELRSVGTASATYHDFGGMFTNRVSSNPNTIWTSSMTARIVSNTTPVVLKITQVQENSANSYLTQTTSSNFSNSIETRTVTVTMGANTGNTRVAPVLNLTPGQSVDTKIRLYTLQHYEKPFPMAISTTSGVNLRERIDLASPFVPLQPQTHISTSKPMEWSSNSGIPLESLSGNFLGFENGAIVTTTTAAWMGASNTLRTPLINGAPYIFRFIFTNRVPRPSNRYRIGIRSISPNVDGAWSGIVGGIGTGSTPSGTFSNVNHISHGDGIFEINGTFTPNQTSSTWEVRIGPNSTVSGEQIGFIHASITRDSLGAIGATDGFTMVWKGIVKNSGEFGTLLNIQTFNTDNFAEILYRGGGSNTYRAFVRASNSDSINRTFTNAEADINVPVKISLTMNNTVGYVKINEVLTTTLNSASVKLMARALNKILIGAGGSVDMHSIHEKALYLPYFLPQTDFEDLHQKF